MLEWPTKTHTYFVNHQSFMKNIHLTLKQQEEGQLAHIESKQTERTESPIDLKPGGKFQFVRCLCLALPMATFQILNACKLLCPWSPMECFFFA